MATARDGDDEQVHGNPGLGPNRGSEADGAEGGYTGPESGTGDSASATAQGASNDRRQEALTHPVAGESWTGNRLYPPSNWERIAPGRDPGESWRDEARRDYARVVHSPAFRRLQGKTQLFPGNESDFFRNRLTHSLEVAQIAESIAHRINGTDGFFQANPIDSRVCMTAALMHDLGHPPFGHNGEHALDDRMLHYGGFEGNAQTLRIVSRLEKKAVASDAASWDQRCGLNLTYRGLASILKYDRQIPHLREEAGVRKGYYADDADLVTRIIEHVSPGFDRRGELKTIECAIMDIADDISYSTYDLEDSLKAGFLTPAAILSSNPRLLDRVAAKVERATGKATTGRDVLDTFVEIFGDTRDEGVVEDEGGTYAAVRAFVRSRAVAEDGYLRTELTSQLVGEFVNGVEVELNAAHPELSKVRLGDEVHRKVETLKNYTYEATIFSTRLKVAEFRGYEVVTSIFDALAGSRGYLLMPDDVRELWVRNEANASARMRVVCDFVAGMTDRYAVEFYARLHSDNAQSIFKPV